MQLRISLTCFINLKMGWDSFEGFAKTVYLVIKEYKMHNSPPGMSLPP